MGTMTIEWPGPASGYQLMTNHSAEAIC